MNDTQDLFISHAGADKETYINPLTDALRQQNVTFWLDNIEIGWGDSITSKINEGLNASRFILLCLSENYIKRPWPEAEFGAAISTQNTTGLKRVLPLILNSKERVLKSYPLLTDLAFREFTEGVDLLARDLSQICSVPSDVLNDERIRVVVESIHTGALCNIRANPRASIGWLLERAKSGHGVRDTADAGTIFGFSVKWALVDAKLEDQWAVLSKSERRRAVAMVLVPNEKPSIAHSSTDRLDEIGVYDGIVFHLHGFAEGETILYNDRSSPFGPWMA